MAWGGPGFPAVESRGWILDTDWGGSGAIMSWWEREGGCVFNDDDVDGEWW